MEKTDADNTAESAAKNIAIDTQKKADQSRH